MKAVRNAAQQYVNQRFNPASGNHLFESNDASLIVEVVSGSFNPASGNHLFESREINA